MRQNADRSRLPVEVPEGARLQTAVYVDGAGVRELQEFSGGFSQLPVGPVLLLLHVLFEGGGSGVAAYYANGAPLRR